MNRARVRVWDPVVRVLHWTLVAAVALAAASTFSLFGAHQPAGYVALAAVLARTTWGWIGVGHARWRSFLRGPRATLRYAGDVLAGRAARHLGHNPLGAWMMVALMACVGGLALTGWLYTTDRFWGDETVETVHRVLAWTLAVLVALHVIGAVATGWMHRENLVRAMLDGRKRAPESDARL